MKIVLFITLVSTGFAWNVVQITEFVRHGARTGTYFFPNKDIPEEAAFGHKQLTANGRAQHYLLGLELKRRYPSVFGKEGENINRNEMDLFSSPSSRCKESAMSQLIAIFPFGSGKKVGETIDSKYWKPPFEGLNNPQVEGNWALPQGMTTFDMTINSDLMDDMFNPNSGKVTCPNYYKRFKTLKEEAYKKHAAQVQKVVPILTDAGLDPKKIFNESEWDIGSVGSMASELKCRESYYGKGYEKLSEENYEKIWAVQSLKFALHYEDLTLAKLKTNRIARNIVAGIEDYIKSTKPKKKFRLFVGHDTGIHPFSLRFNITSSKCVIQKMNGETPSERCEGAPYFATSYIYELATKDQKDYFVRVLYDGKPVKVCAENEDDFYCAFEAFKQKMAELFFMDEATFVQACGNALVLNSMLTPNTVTREVVEGPSFFWLIVTGAFVGLLFILVCLKISTIRKEGHEEFLTESIKFAFMDSEKDGDSALDLSDSRLT